MSKDRKRKKHEQRKALKALRREKAEQERRRVELMAEGCEHFMQLAYAAPAGAAIDCIASARAAGEIGGPEAARFQFDVTAVLASAGLIDLGYDGLGTITLRGLVLGSEMELEASKERARARKKAAR